MRLIDMDTHFAPTDEFAYVADDLKHLTPAWLPHGQGKVAMVAPGSPEPPRRAARSCPARASPATSMPMLGSAIWTPWASRCSS